MKANMPKPRMSRVSSVLLVPGRCRVLPGKITVKGLPEGMLRTSRFCASAPVGVWLVPGGWRPVRRRPSSHGPPRPCFMSVQGVVCAPFVDLLPEQARQRVHPDPPARLLRDRSPERGRAGDLHPALGVGRRLNRVGRSA